MRDRGSPGAPDGLVNADLDRGSWHAVDKALPPNRHEHQA
jgi:hypothetical protein